MAESVKEIPNTAFYDWDTWIKLGAKYRLTQGVDFDVSLKTMSCQIHTASRRRKLRATVRVVKAENAVYFEIYGMDDKPRTNRGRKPNVVAKPAKAAKVTKVKPTTPKKKKAKK
jgi:hypothetical protein